MNNLRNGYPGDLRVWLTLGILDCEEYFLVNPSGNWIMVSSGIRLIANLCAKVRSVGLMRFSAELYVNAGVIIFWFFIVANLLMSRFTES